MASLRKSYFLVPSWNIRPDDVKLGSVVINPKVPQRVLSAESLTMDIETQIPTPFEEKQCSGTAKKEGKWNVGLFSTFMELITLGGQASVSSDSTLQVDYSCDTIETRSFVPSLPYITKAVEDAAVKAYLKTGGLGAKVFMITGIKVATNITLTTIEENKKQTIAKVGVDVPVVQATVGLKTTHDSANCEKHTRTVAGPIVFAFELEKIRVNLRGKAVHEEYIQGAALGKTDRVADYIVERAGNDLDEDEVEDFDVKVRHGTDDETGEACQIFW